MNMSRFILKCRKTVSTVEIPPDKFRYFNSVNDTHFTIYLFTMTPSDLDYNHLNSPKVKL